MICCHLQHTIKIPPFLLWIGLLWNSTSIDNGFSIPASIRQAMTNTGRMFVCYVTLHRHIMLFSNVDGEEKQSLAKRDVFFEAEKCFSPFAVEKKFSRLWTAEVLALHYPTGVRLSHRTRQATRAAHLSAVASPGGCAGIPQVADGLFVPPAFRERCWPRARKKAAC